MLIHVLYEHSISLLLHSHNSNNGAYEFRIKICRAS